MALKLRLKPRERVVINGCVLENENRRYTLTVSNFAHIIRGSDILQEEDAVTPVQRTYFLIQCMLLESHNADKYTSTVAKMMADLYTAFGRREIQNQVTEAMDHIGRRDYYKALVCLRPVMTYEGIVLGASADGSSRAGVAGPQMGG